MKPLTGLSPQREQQIQEALLIRLTASIEPKFRDTVGKALTDLAKAGQNENQQAKVMAEHKRSIQELLYASWDLAFKRFGRRMLDGFKTMASPGIMKRTNDVYDQAFRSFVMKYSAAKVGEIAGTTFNQATKIIEDAVQEGLEGGLGQNAIASLIQSKMTEQAATISVYRARMIARTEIHSAATASNHAAAKSTGLQLEKRWVSSKQEGRTRPDHLNANGQTVAMNEYFIVGGEQLFTPGDPNGSAGQVINCRCVQVYGLPD